MSRKGANMSLYEDNLQMISKVNPFLYKEITSAVDSVNFDIYEDSESNIVKINHQSKSVDMHSRYDIDNEMKNMFKNLSSEDKTVVVFGIGNGYFIQYIKREYKNISKVIVIEPSIKLFNHFLEKESFLNFVKGMSVSFIIGKQPEFVASQIGNYIDGNTKIAYHLSYSIIFDIYYHEVIKEMRKYVTVRMGNLNFQRHINKGTILNFLVNVQHNPVNKYEVKGLFSEKPLIVVGAGPSLNKNMHLLNDLKSRAIIVAVGSAIKILDSNGIKPHFRMAFDPSIKEMKVVRNLKDDTIPFIYSNNLYFRILKKYSGPKISVNISSDYGGEYVCEKWNLENDQVTTGSSIAVSAIDLGVRYNSSKIVLMGFDASYKLDELYAKGLEDPNGDSLSGLQYYPVNDINGEVVYTDSSFMMHKYGVEFITKSNSHVKFINATEGGLFVEGMEHKPLLDVIESELIEEYPELVDNIYFSSQYADSKYSDKVMDLYNDMLSESKEILKINEEAIKAVKKIHKNVERLKVSRISSDLKSLNYYEEELDEHLLYNKFIFPNISHIIRAYNDIYRYNGFDKDIEVDNKLKEKINIYSIRKEIIEFVIKHLEMAVDNGLYEYLAKEIYGEN